MNIAVVLAGGVGSRYGGNIPKQYCFIGNKEVISFSINEAKKCASIDKVLVVCDKAYQERISNQYKVEVCDGGESRNLSVDNALEYIKSKYSCDKIIFLDSARPLIKAQYINSCMQKLDEYDCVITTQKIVDSLGRYGELYVNREDYYLIQTPEAFKFDIFCQNFDKNSENTALCQFMPKADKIYQNFGMKQNFKITYQGDLEYISQFLKQ
ncbi:MAG: 2-C-methyl-D-erythritol 4-phosphate cytidylyltransferase [Clostridia bacterium]|nr:2-C-methyl-D-erythritol 4-phosphate cytidylyltransferase [Clostridia bacterium]